MFPCFQCPLYSETSQYHILQFLLDRSDGSLQCGTGSILSLSATFHRLKSDVGPSDFLFLSICLWRWKLHLTFLLKFNSLLKFCYAFVSLHMMQIDFVGWSKFSVGPSLAVDDVSFSKELCQQIPWKPTAGEIRNENCSTYWMVVCGISHPKY